MQSCLQHLIHCSRRLERGELNVTKDVKTLSHSDAKLCPLIRVCHTQGSRLQPSPLLVQGELRTCVLLGSQCCRQAGSKPASELASAAHTELPLQPSKELLDDLQLQLRLQASRLL